MPQTQFNKLTRARPRKNIRYKRTRTDHYRRGGALSPVFDDHAFLREEEEQQAEPDQDNPEPEQGYEATSSGSDDIGEPEEDWFEDEKSFIVDSYRPRVSWRGRYLAHSEYVDEDETTNDDNDGNDKDNDDYEDEEDENEDNARNEFIECDDDAEVDTGLEEVDIVYDADNELDEIDDSLSDESSSADDSSCWTDDTPSPPYTTPPLFPSTLQVADALLGSDILFSGNTCHHSSDLSPDVVAAPQGGDPVADGVSSPGGSVDTKRSWSSISQEDEDYWEVVEWSGSDLN